MNYFNKLSTFLCNSDLPSCYSKFLESLDSSFIISVADSNGKILYVNDNLCTISEYRREELLGRSHSLFNSGYHSKAFFTSLWNTVLSKDIWVGDICNLSKSGNLFWTKTIIIPISDEHGDISYLITLRNDVTKLHANLNSEFINNLKFLQNCLFKFKKDLNGNVIVDIIEGRIANELDIETSSSKGRLLCEVLDIEVTNILFSYINSCFDGNPCEFEFNYRGCVYLVELNPIYGLNVNSEEFVVEKSVVSVVGSMLDISDLKNKESEILSLAYSDYLTNLPNRVHLTNIIENEISLGSRFSLLFLDLDRFKYINDLFGHNVGDDFLIAVSKRLVSVLRSEDVIGRFGGDEFLIIIKDIDNIDDLDSYIELILNCFQDIFNLKSSNIDLFVTTSIGVSIYPDNGTDINELIRCADTAMYYSKEKGKNRYSYYTSEISDSFERQLYLDSQLRNALAKNEFLLYFQPKISSCKEILGAEVLLRWNHSTEGFISPVEFIPIAEETGLIYEIGYWVLHESIKKLYEWNNIKGLKKSLSVNISVNQLINNRFINDLIEFLNKYPIDTNYLEFEITESTMLNISEIKPILEIIKKLNINLSIDDFGTGYSSLTYLSNLSVDYLKIDQSFIRDLSENNKSIVKTIINLAHNMNIKTIAEGVETLEHVDFLLQEKCEILQGYFFGRPVDIQTFENELLNN